MHIVVVTQVVVALNQNSHSISLRSSSLIHSLLVLTVTALAYTTVTYVAETVSRAEKLALLPCEAGSKCWICLKPDCNVTNVNSLNVCVPIKEGESVNSGIGYSPIMNSTR